MSIEAITWALRVPVGGNQKVVLLGLANHAHPDGGESYPALDTLASYAACDRSTARRNVRKLAADGWIELDGKGPRGQDKYRLAMGVAKCHPSQNATVASEHEGGGISTRGGVAPVPPEPSFNRRGEPSGASAARGRGTDDSLGIPEEMQMDVEQLLSAKTKVNGRVVTREEMRTAAAAIAEFNRQGEARFSLGGRPHFPSIVMRIREHPSWDAAKHVRLVQSAWRVKWWERNGNRQRPKPNVIYGERAFENVVQDASEEAAGRLAAPDMDLRTKVWPDGRTWDQLSRREQENAKQSVVMGIRPWEPAAEAVPVNANGNGNGFTSLLG